MPALNLEAGQPVNLTATGNVSGVGRDCTLIGFFVNSTNAGTLVLRVGGSGGTALGTITPAAGAFYRYPMSCPGGLHATIGGTALDVTFLIVPGIA